MENQKAKEAAGLKALEFVKEGMRLGLGTGSTAACFIKNLIKKCQSGFKVEAVATSEASMRMAKDGGIPLLDVNTISSLDLTIDGADEIDPQKRLIKGAGGALVREKIIATMSEQMIVIADESKLVEKLGTTHPLPIEVIPFGAEASKKHIEDKGYTGKWRRDKNGENYVTDNNNWIYDLNFSYPINSLEDLHLSLIMIPGVVDTGFFFHLAQKCVIGKQNGDTLVF